MKEFDVIVIGGGMVGLAFAIELSQKKNCSIAIVEPNTSNPSIKKKFHTRVSAITPSSEAYLKSLNIWDDIKRKQVLLPLRCGIRILTVVLTSMRKTRIWIILDILSRMI